MSCRDVPTKIIHSLNHPSIHPFTHFACKCVCICLPLEWINGSVCVYMYVYILHRGRHTSWLLRWFVYNAVVVWVAISIWDSKSIINNGVKSHTHTYIYTLTFTFLLVNTYVCIYIYAYEPCQQLEVIFWICILKCVSFVSQKCYSAYEKLFTKPNYSTIDFLTLKLVFVRQFTSFIEIYIFMNLHIFTLWII